MCFLLVYSNDQSHSSKRLERPAPTAGLFSDATLVSGGLAYGRVDLEGTSTVSGAVNSAFPFSITQVIGPHSHVNTGWVVGYGTEGVIDLWGVTGLGK
jgi:hypothetical protein